MTNSYSGSTAIAAVADCLWNFQSDKEKFTGKLIMEGIRGDHQQPMNFVYDMDKQRYFFVGSNKEVSRAKENAEHCKLLRHLPRTYADKVARSEFVARMMTDLHLSETAILNRIRDAGRFICQEGEGKKNAPFYLWLNDDGTTLVDGGDGAVMV
jgi:hypothetical protein